MLSSRPSLDASTPSLTVAEARALAAKAREILEQRKRERTGKLLVYQDDPLGFVDRHLLGFLWSKQREIAVTVRDNRLVAVRSCHDVGKTYLAAILASWWIACHAPGEAFVVTLAPTGHQVKALLWREMNRIHKQGKLPGRMLMTEWKIDEELIAYGRSPADNDPTSAQGLHQKFVLVILDEACGIARTLWDAVSSLAANEYSRILAIGNPDDPATEFNDVCKPGSDWKVIGISAFESPNFTDEPVPDYLRPLLVSPTWVAERKKRWGETSALYKSKVLGEFPEQTKDGLIPLGAITAAVQRELPPGLPHELGVDVGAGKGGDNSVIYERRGGVARKKFRSNESGTMALVGEVMKLLRGDCAGATRIKIDDIGVGSGVTSRLKELKFAGDDEERGLLAGVDIVGVNVGEGSTVEIEARDDNEPAQRYQQTERFANLKAQINWGLRLRFIDGDIDLEDDGDLQDQAGDIRYQTTSRGQVIMESKRDMAKRRSGKENASPDDWDALVLAFADHVGSDLGVWDQLGRQAMGEAA